MGFLKNILSNTLGDTMADVLTGETAKSLLKTAGKTAASKSLENATKFAVGKAVDKTASKAMKSLNKPSVLDMPAPPAVPQTHKTMSVMIAVNGETYGPYERTTLIEMIANGTLTRDTYVFIQGMSGWEAAKNVNEVAELFSNDVPLPPAPPVPWSKASETSTSNAQYDNSLSPRLNQLINAAVADGEISDMERQVLIRNAQNEGVAMDEFVMVLEARIYERRQQLLSKQRQEETQQKAAEVAAASATAAIYAATQQNKPAKPEVRKCPACGQIINDSKAAKCPQCGYEFDNHGVAESGAGMSVVEQLSAQLKQIDNEEQEYKLKKKSFWSQAPNFNERRRQAIKSAPIPSDKTDFTDFLILCANNAKDSGDFIQDAWKTKRNQLFEKAQMSFKDDKDIMALVEKYSKKKKFGLF